MKTTNICETEPNKTKASCRSSLTPSGKETDRASSTDPGDHMRT